MSKKILKLVVLGLFLVLGSAAQAKSPSADYTAGYHDGCQSSKGHYTRSRYKYAHSSRYHRGWLKGKRSCVRSHTKRTQHRAVRKRHTVKKHRTTRRKTHTSYAPCNTEVPWDAFRRGWDHGNRSARGHFRVDKSGCSAYRQGWVSGYRDCHCGDLKKPDTYAQGYYAGCSSISSIKIRDDYYYRTRAGYRHGWRQGYRDCRGMYR